MSASAVRCFCAFLAGAAGLESDGAAAAAEEKEEEKEEENTADAEAAVAEEAGTAPSSLSTTGASNSMSAIPTSSRAENAATLSLSFVAALAAFRSLSDCFDTRCSMRRTARPLLVDVRRGPFLQLDQRRPLPLQFPRAAGQGAVALLPGRLLLCQLVAEAKEVKEGLHGVLKERAQARRHERCGWS